MTRPRFSYTDMRPLRIAQEMDVSIIIPTLNEAANLPPLLSRIDKAMVGRTYEVIIVDDNSQDDTQAVCTHLAASYPLRLIVRKLPLGGLSGAVLRGMKKARGTELVVMDADLQHPPESIPALLTALKAGARFALGSRYIRGGKTGAGWGKWRRLNSGVATLLAKPFTGHICDPMSGFFALSAETFRRAVKLNPVGYKIALELLCKCGIPCVFEVPISFGCRAAGESKLTWRQRVKFVQHLGRLYAFKFPRVAFVMKCTAAALISAAFATATNPRMLPLIGVWAVVATAYATRANRPQPKPIGWGEDREMDLRPKIAAAGLAA